MIRLAPASRLFFVMLALMPALSTPAMGSWMTAAPVIIEDPVTVEGVGRAESAKEARKQAIVAALRKVVGEYVDAEMLISNDQVVSDTILSFTNASGVKSEQVGEPRLIGDEFEIVMRVTVTPTPLVAKVKASLSTSTGFDGAALAAEISQAGDNLEAKKEVFRKAMSGLPYDILEISLLNAEGEPLQGIDRKLLFTDRSGTQRLAFLVRIGFNRDAWKRTRKSLDTLFRAAAASSTENAWTIDSWSPGKLSIPYLDVPMKARPRELSWDWTKNPRPNGVPRECIPVLLQSASLGPGGRELRFDLHWLDHRLISAPPLVYHSGGPVFPAPTLQVDLVDSDGDTIEGKTIRLGGEDDDVFFIRLIRERENADVADYAMIYEDSLERRLSPLAMRPFVMGYDDPDRGYLFIGPRLWTQGHPQRLDAEAMIIPVPIPISDALEDAAEARVTLIPPQP